MNVLQAQQECDSPKMLRTQSYNILDQLKERKLNHEKRLQDVNNAIQALESNPELVKCLELIAKAQ